MNDDDDRDPILKPAEAFALGQLAIVRAFAEALVSMPLVQVDRELQQFHATFPSDLATRRELGHPFYRSDIETVRILMKARGALVHLATDRAAAIEQERRLCAAAADNSARGRDRRDTKSGESSRRRSAGRAAVN